MPSFLGSLTVCSGGDGFGYSHDTDDAWNEWYDTGANWADKLPERVQVWFYQINNKR